MKGVDIVVRGSIGHMSAFMAQRGCLVVCGDAGDALGDSIYEARIYVRGEGRRARRRLRREGDARRARAPSCASCSSAPASTTSTPRTSAATARRGSSTTSRSTTRARTDVRARGVAGLRESYLFDRSMMADIQRAAAEGIPASVASEQSGGCRTSTTCSCWERASRGIHSRGTGSAATRTSCSARGLRRSRSSSASRSRSPA